jgi:hypothetical protein
MFPKRLQDITAADLQGLIDRQETESQTIDFKRDLPGRDNSARHELCADVVAFANSLGGDIVFGIQEDAEGKASAIAPWTDNPDETAIRIMDTVANGVDPKITGLHAHPVAVPGGHVLILRIPKSWHAPHRVKTNQHFFIREGTRKRQLEMPEIGAAFLHSAGNGERVRNFRLDRLGKILSDQAPIRLADEGPIGILHVVPLQPSPDAEISPREFHEKRNLSSMGTGGRVALDSRLNLDGALVHCTVHGQGCYSYTQLFRDGNLEAVRVFGNRLDGNGKFVVPSTAYESEILDFLGRMLPKLQAIELGPPFVVMYSLLRTSGAVFGIGSRSGSWFTGNTVTDFDRDALIFPEVVIDSVQMLDVQLKPLFDVVWQSVDELESANYGPDGRWRDR